MIRAPKQRHASKNTSGKGNTKKIKMKGPYNKSQKGERTKGFQLLAQHEHQTYYYCVEKADK
jgi:hypothetical protein